VRLGRILISILLLLLQPGVLASEMQILRTYHLHKAEFPGEPGFSGDRQHGRAGELVRPLRVQVVNHRSEPVIGIPVIFEVVGYPAGGGDYLIYPKLVPTDSAGIAAVNFRLGTAGGEYQLIARIRSDGQENVQLYTLFAREPDWLLFLVVGLVGGLALFLLGMDTMSRGLLRSAGDKMRSILGTLTNNRVAGLGLGAFVTMIIQSSSATNVMLVSFVNAGLMKFRQTLGVILGAALGTTITAQLIALRLTDFALLFIAAGFALHAMARREQIRFIGDSIMGFGILFFGMYIMSESMLPLRSYDPFIQLLLRLEYPLLGILVGTLFTALIQSSSAFIGIMIILGMQGLISLEASIPLLFGANIGTAVTAFLASIKAGREARKVALAIAMFKVFGVLLFIWWIEPFARLIAGLSPANPGGTDEISMLAEVVPRQIANAHTVYNVFVALLVLPFTGLIARLVDWMVPVKERPENTFRLHYLDESMLKTPVLALSLAKQETIRMAGVVHEMVSSVLPVFLEKDPAAIKDIEMKEAEVNFLRDHIKAYLLKMSRTGIREERVNESFQILYTVKELELMADVVSSSLVRKAGSWLTAGYSFSSEGKEELRQYHEKTCRQIKRAIGVFTDVNIDKALEMKQKYKQDRIIAFEFEKQHFERLKRENHDTMMSSNTHLEFMAMLRNISSHATNIARILLQWSDHDEPEA
jgi:phosphate:Na+ symporter